MKLQPESKKELTRIACGTAICTAALWVAFAAMHLVGWVKFDYTVVLGSLIGAAVAIGNFAGICIVCQKVIDEQDEKRRKATLQASYNVMLRFFQLIPWNNFCTYVHSPFFIILLSFSVTVHCMSGNYFILFKFVCSVC